MDSNNSSDEGMDYGPSFATRVTSQVLEPLRFLVSKNALTAYLGTMLFCMTAVGMVFVSVFAYGVFYYKFIPQAGLESVIYMQFGDGNPWGTAMLDPGLIASQPYDVHVELELPRTPSNLAAGNFMLDLTFLSHPSMSARTGETTAPPIAHSRRPAILTYTSPLIDISSKISFMPLYILGWRRESERLVVPLMEGVEFARGAHNKPESLRLEIQSPVEIHVYAVKVTFTTRFTGLRWIMYHWRTPSFFLFSYMFWSFFMVSFSTSWIAMTCMLIMRGPMKDEEEEEEEIKAEDEGGSEGTVKKESVDPFPEFPRAGSGDRIPSIKMEFESDEESNPDPIMTPNTGASEISGFGTATSTAEASGMQQRRSQLWREEDF
ncbi:putative adipose-regulatory protein-domain-containing protein [Aspergillus californicus]